MKAREIERRVIPRPSAALMIDRSRKNAS